MASRKLQSVAAQFAGKKSGTWKDHSGPFGECLGYRIGPNIEVRSLRAGTDEVLIQFTTFKHVELQGGQVATSDPVPPSEAQGTWLRTRTLTPEDSTLRIGDYVFLQVSFGTVPAITFRVRTMAALSIEQLPNSDSYAD